MNEITKRGLAVSDDEWVDAEGYIICWHQIAYPGEKWAKPVTYFLGQGPPGGSWGGWESVRHAHVYPSHQAAAAAVPAMLAGPHHNAGPGDVRIVKVRIQQPVTVLDDMPYDILQKLAEL